MPGKESQLNLPGNWMNTSGQPMHVMQRAVGLCVWREREHAACCMVLTEGDFAS